ncbi:hypothetical protein [Paenibacillus ginsengihumi]|uniref:hypothetical protein n=1 Tax=Paenibacillus ginsengihumi TaxID=431596 RepID=UPI00035D5257|nr:hypothetical protein [Paenibacillus ginsengihumi]
MNNQLIELKMSLKELIQNLIHRIDPICQSLMEGQEERLSFFIEDLAMFTETMLVLVEHQVLDFDLELFNEKVQVLLDHVESKDLLYIADLLKYDIKPLLIYWDGCITND